MNNKIIDKITKLKESSNSIILAHNYQLPEIQDIADYLGDSLDLAIKATKTNAKNIIFCGVDFMVESAKILNPEKNVIIPDISATCPLANMIKSEDLIKLKKLHNNAEIVSYINTTADIKALSDICCTSANGKKVVQSLYGKKIIFIPDINLGNYIQRLVPEKEMILWPGFCATHHKISIDEILKIKNKNPRAQILVHPECRLHVIDIADQVLSTNGMINYVKKSDSNKFIIGTEKDICYRLKKENPDKSFYQIKSAICPNMKKITLEKVLNSLKTLEPKIKLSKEIIQKAKKPLQKMMDVGRGD
jgi:quinolinate synthase